MKLEMQIVRTKRQYDSDDVYWTDQKGNRRGKGYKTKDTNKIGLIKCPECLYENYSMAVLTGCCAWCNFDGSLEETIK